MKRQFDGVAVRLALLLAVALFPIGLIAVLQSRHIAETVDERGCRITVRDRGAVLNLVRMLNEWYEQGLPRREDGDDEENDPWDDVEPGVWCSVATWLYEFDFYGRAGSLSSLPWRPG